MPRVNGRLAAGDARLVKDCFMPIANSAAVDASEYELTLLSALSQQFPNVDSAMAEIARLSAILTLPKGTVHVISDIHGEDKKLRHVINNASGTLASDRGKTVRHQTLAAPAFSRVRHAHLLSRRGGRAAWRRTKSPTRHKFAPSPSALCRNQFELARTLGGALQLEAGDARLSIRVS